MSSARRARHRLPRGSLAVALAFVIPGIAACRPDDVGPPSTVPAPAGTVSARVTRVTDGDTFHAVENGSAETVRLIGVDTPEVDWYGGEGECFGPEAARYAQDRLSGRSVGLAFDRDLRDPYGRLLAYVTLGSELFNLTLVEEGYAVTLEVPPNTARAEQFDEAEASARERRVGLWAACPAPA
jgi:micrococcal nuclease